MTSWETGRWPPARRLGPVARTARLGAGRSIFGLCSDITACEGLSKNKYSKRIHKSNTWRAAVGPAGEFRELNSHGPVAQYRERNVDTEQHGAEMPFERIFGKCDPDPEYRKDRKHCWKQKDEKFPRGRKSA